MYEFTEEMKEISGFSGGYEKACRDMLKAGLEWLDKHPNANPLFSRFKGIYGVLQEDNEDAKQLSNACISICKDCSGAMHHAVINHILFIKKNGWKKYTEKMKK